MIEYMFSSRSGVHGLETLCADQSFISIEPGLKLPFSGSGSSSEDAITLIIDPKSGRLLADQDAVLLADQVWFKLTVWVEKIEEVLSYWATIPADPIDAIKVMVEYMGEGHAQSADEALLSVRDAFHSEQHAEAISKIDILAAKIAGGEAPYIKKCLWLALLASTLPSSKEGMFVNRLIESEGGRMMSIENLGDRLYLGLPEKVGSTKEAFQF